MYTLLLSFISTVFSGEAFDSYQACIGCHGSDGEGNAVLGAPALAGQSPTYIEKQLQAFKKGWRGMNPEDVAGQMMRSVTAVLLEDGLIENVARYSAALPGSKAVVSGLNFDGETLQNGKLIYGGICASCHGVAAEGIDALAAPRLNHLSQEYLVRQLVAYRSGIRGGHEDDVYGKQMQQMAALLSDDRQIVDVAQFIVRLGN